MADLKLGENFADRVFITSRTTGLGVTGLSPTCYIMNNLGTRVAGTVVEISNGWYKITDFTPTANGNWSLEWGGVNLNLYTIQYPYKEFKVGGGMLADVFADVDGPPYGWGISEGNVVGTTPWSKIGYNPSLVANTEADVCPEGGTYVFPTSALIMTITGGVNDNSNTIFSATSDAGGTTTTLVDADVDFTAGTPVSVGDAIVLDKSSQVTTPEWGYVTTVSAHTLTVSNGFSEGGTGALRTYLVLKRSSYTGAQAVLIEYLDTNFNPFVEIVLMNAATGRATVNTMYRINSFRIAICGTLNVAGAAITLTNGGVTYDYITVGYTRARSCCYTVPAGYTLYIVQFTAGYGYNDPSVHPTVHYCRAYTRATQEPSTFFHTGNVFYPYTEVLLSNSTAFVPLEIPSKFVEKVDMKVSCLPEFAGVIDIVLRGYLKVN